MMLNLIILVQGIFTAIALAMGDTILAGRMSFYTPQWDGWVKHTARWSAYCAPTFSSVFTPQTEEELSQGLAFLSSNNIPYLATKAGGHGNVPSLGEYKNVVQISLDNFRDVTMHPDKTVTVGGGARMEDLIPTLYAANREMSVHGVMLGGGMGRLMGKYGLISDALVRARVVLWNGTVVDSSEEVNPDLFWGLRGAGHGLGVVVESVYKTWPDQGGMHYNADMTFTDQSLEGVVEVARKLIEDELDEGLFLILGFPLVMVNIVYAHDEQAGRRVTALFASTGDDLNSSTTKHAITRLSLSEKSMTFRELGSGDALPSVCDVNLSNTLYTASTPSLFGTAAMRELYTSYGAFVTAHPLANRSIVLFEAASGRAVATLPGDFSAYAHRGRMTTNAIIQATWDGDDAVADPANAWGSGARNLLARPEVSGYDRLYAYVNYANNDEPLAALYGYEEWRHERLTGLKRKYDPHGNFNAYRPVPLEMHKWETKSPMTEPVPIKDEL